MKADRTAVAEFDEQLARSAALATKALDEALPGETVYPRTLHRAMRYAALTGGKRVRAFLVLTACEAAGGPIERALPIAAALEMVHAYSLVHDDLPAMDDDDLRRGKPSCHKVFGEAVALLAGDALLTCAMDTLTRLPAAGVEAAAALQITSEIAQAAGSEGMVGGQVVDLLSEGRVRDAGAPSRLDYVHAHKTGALLTASARAGALAASAGDKELEALTTYATHVGTAFQIVDDLLDEVGDASQLGKEPGRDRDRKKLTYPAVHGLDAARAEALRRAAAAEEAVREIETLNAAAVNRLAGLAQFVVDRTH